MSSITKEQEEILKNLRVVRVSALTNANTVLNSIKGIIRKDGKEDPLFGLYCTDAQKDSDNGTASFLIMSPDGLVLQFFTLRCGELFEPKIDDFQTKTVNEMYNNLLTSSSMTPDKSVNATYRKAILRGKNPNIVKYELNSIVDKNYESSNFVQQVHETYPSIEIKYWGSNGDKKVSQYWESLLMPAQYKMGQVLFWYCIVQKLQEAIDVVGSKYVYLFAADVDPDGVLVNYYRTKFGFEYPKNIHVNKPCFDWHCKFMLQPISQILKGREDFLNNFNSDTTGDIV